MATTQILSSPKILTPDENFKNCKTRVGGWYGRWTKWNPLTAEKLVSFKSLRHLSFTDENETAIVHENTYWYPNGEILKRPKWVFGLPEFYKDGLYHPAMEGTRAYFFENGDGIYTRKQYTFSSITDHYLASELFLNISEKESYSVAFIYNNEGGIKEVFLVRESSDIVWDDKGENVVSLSSKPPFWSESDAIKTFEAPEKWEVPLSGTRDNLVLGNDEMRVETVTSEWKGHFEEQDKDYKTLSLPDNVYLHFPVQLKLGEGFTLSTLWINSEKEEKRLVELKFGNDFFVKNAFSFRFSIKG